MKPTSFPSHPLRLRSSRPFRAVQRAGAGAALFTLIAASIGSTLAVSSVGCSQCAAGCENVVHMTIHGAANVLKNGSAIFEACGSLCGTWKFDGTACTPVGSVNGASCDVDGDDLVFDVHINNVARDTASINVSSPTAMLGDPPLFNAFADVDTTPVEVCGQECHEGDVEFTIPPP